MKGQGRELKKATELTWSDFEAHPIWTWAEAMDESLVMPVPYTGALEEDHDALFVACEFILHDGSLATGEINVRVSNRQVYVIRFPKADGDWFSIPLHPRLRGKVTPEHVAAFLGKAANDVFPIEYRTPYVWPDGEPLMGRIETI